MIYGLLLSCIAYAVSVAVVQTIPNKTVIIILVASFLTGSILYLVRGVERNE